MARITDGTFPEGFFFQECIQVNRMYMQVHNTVSEYYVHEVAVKDCLKTKLFFAFLLERNDIEKWKILET